MARAVAYGPLDGGFCGGSAEAPFSVSRKSEYLPERIRFTTDMNSLVVSCCSDNGCQIVFR